MKTKEDLLQYFETLDKFHWLRLVIFLTPGAIAKKLTDSFDAPSGARFAATCLLAAGFGCYVGWGFIRKKIKGQSGENSAIDLQVQESADLVREAPVKNISQASTLTRVRMQELVGLCAGDAALALSLVNDELELNPALDYAMAIETAHRRKEMLVKRQSGN